ncbi:germination protein PC [Brevibacillus reuszeri]|uniref:Germination protein PC n=1 Tax=Brevibacillus reuszeri TaxID=54915 RepID=A0A0K9YUW5_9BACL|nr:spore germination protein GerPC [Brevibacillus reuszeri]KNB72493.1 spore gernimation protein [Brevibacillus reuszeri]MED1860832.1 spore germination protein GerPC [Brevibacillus reuszeri]GED70654.1 germination protein PC [Brevibacillus reuszeri]
MYMSPELMQYFQQLHDYLQVQNKKMESMKQMLEQLQQDVNELKEKQVPSVIKNEYKFDLLKVERLEGTLNIGLNPKSSDSSIGDFAINQSMDVPSPPHSASDSFERVQREINRYLDHDAYRVLERIEDECGYPLDDAYRGFIMDDIRKQIDHRIRYYLNQFDTSQWEPEQIEAWEQKTVQKVKRDIERTCETFIQNLPRERNDS